ncbi:MAG: sensor histidine kinase [Bacteroidota bacterium]
MEFSRKNQLYWLCQFGGWSLFTTLELINYSLIDGFHPLLLLNGLVNILLGVFITHIYRKYLIRSAWLNLPTVKLIPRVAAAVLIMSVCMAGINIPLDRLTYPIFREIELNSAILFNYFFSWSKYILLWALIYHLFQYWEKSLESEKEKYQLAAAIRDNAFNHLVAQLNPHFLFNSLNSIRTLVDVNPPQAQRAIILLAELLRSTLKYGKEKWISMYDEMQVVLSYLEIEKIRFDERLSIQQNIDSSLVKNIQLPPFTIQTLVENAVKHGIAKSKSGGNITINCTQDEAYLRLTVVNTGVLTNNRSNGVGLSNLTERLRLLYADAAELTLMQRSENEVEATLRIRL